MNKHQRRAAAKSAKIGSREARKIIAIHEAGHAAARYLTADHMGFTVDDAIAFIDVGFDPRPRLTRDGLAMVSTSATTYGPVYSRPMIEYLSAHPVPGGSSQAEVAACAVAGIDVRAWAKHKALIALAGPAAEAQYMGLATPEVVRSYQCENDMVAAMRDCALAGMTTAEAKEACAYALEQAEVMMTTPCNRSAVEALASSLPASGRMPGHRAAEIISQALGVAA